MRDAMHVAKASVAKQSCKAFEIARLGGLRPATASDSRASVAAESSGGLPKNRRASALVKPASRVASR